MSGFKNFIIAGAGNIGKLVVEEFLKLQNEGKVASVAFLSRKDNGNDDLVSKGAKRVVVDYSSLESLTSALKGYDVILSTLPATPQTWDAQTTLAKAAKEAGIKLFVPSEFGTPQSSDTFLTKDRLRDEVLKALDLPFTVFYTGPWTDAVLSPPYANMFGIDVAGGKINIKGSGNAPISFTTMHDVVSFLAYVLTSLPRDELGGKIFRIEGDRLSLNEIADLLVDKLGKKLEVTHQPRELLEEALNKNAADFISALLQLWDSGRAVVGTTDQLDNDKYPSWKPKKVVDVLSALYA